MVNVSIDVRASAYGREINGVGAQTRLTQHILCSIGAVGTKMQLGGTPLVIATRKGLRRCTTFVALPATEALSTESACSNNVLIPSITAGPA